VKYARTGDTVTLAMTAEDYDRLLLMLGTAIAAMRQAGNQELAEEWLTWVK
jgi:hypothetical protein